MSRIHKMKLNSILTHIIKKSPIFYKLGMN